MRQKKLFAIRAFMCTYAFMTKSNQQPQDNNSIADAVSAVLDTKFLKAISDPTRVSIIKTLIHTGATDITTISRGLTQDRSVISRHLATLERAGITAASKVGRQVYYDIDGPYVVAKVASILETIKPMQDQCKPFDGFAVDSLIEKGAA